MLFVDFGVGVDTQHLLRCAANDRYLVHINGSAGGI